MVASGHEAQQGTRCRTHETLRHVLKPQIAFRKPGGLTELSTALPPGPRNTKMYRDSFKLPHASALR